MGAWVDFTNHIHIAKKTWENGILKHIGYKDITPEMIEEIAQNNRIERIQIDKNLPESAYREIDRILERRPDLYFRIFGIGTYGNETFDLSVLSQMPHLSKVWIDGYLAKNKEAVNPEYLCELPNLKSVHLELFDCEWLLKYKKMHTLFLGQKAKKHIESINRIVSLKSLSLRGIKVESFDFLKELCLESFALLWCGNSDLTALGDLISLRNLELWRIMKLDNLDFIKSLANLETLKLQDLKHIRTLPDLRRLTRLTDIQIDNVPIDLETLDKSVRKLVHS